MLKIFRDLQEKGGEIIVTERGKPVLRITHYGEKKSKDELFGDLLAVFIQRPPGNTVNQGQDSS